MGVPEMCVLCYDEVHPRERLETTCGHIFCAGVRPDSALPLCSLHCLKTDAIRAHPTSSAWRNGVQSTRTYKSSARTAWSHCVSRKGGNHARKQLLPSWPPRAQRRLQADVTTVTVGEE